MSKKNLNLTKNRTKYEKQKPVNKTLHRCTLDIHVESFEKLKEISLAPKFKGRYQQVLRELLKIALNNQQVLGDLKK